MKLQVTELRIGKVEAAKIDWNGAEIKASLDLALEDYRNMVVTEETLKGSKKVMADLNKHAKAIDDFRKNTVKQLNPDIKAFEAEAKELVLMIKEARKVIDEQVETFIIRQREEKKELVKCAIDSVSHQIELKPKYLERVELKEQYLNSSMTINKVTEDLKLQFNQLLQKQIMEQNKIDTIKVIVDTFNDKLTFKFDPNEFDYLLDSDIAYISSVVNDKVKGRYLEEQAELERIEREKQEAVERAEREAKEKAEREAKEKIEAEKREQELLRLKTQQEYEAKLKKQEFEALEQQRKLQEEQAKVLEAVSKQVEKTVPVENEKSRKRKVTLEIKATKEQMQALKNYMDQYDIEYVKL